MEHIRLDLASYTLTADQAQEIKRAVDQRVIGSQYQRGPLTPTGVQLEAHESMIAWLTKRVEYLERRHGL